MRQLNLQAPFGGRRTFTENLEDQSSTIDHLALQFVFKIALLDRGERTVDNDQLSFVLLAPHRDILHLTGAEQRVGLHLADREDRRMPNHHANCECQTFGLGEPFGRIEIIAQRADVRTQHQRPRTAGHLFLKIAIKAQSSIPSSPSSSPTLRSTGPAGWMVETACL